MTIIKMKDILPNPDQPRTVFEKADLEGLAQSIKNNTLIQPIVVEFESGKYIIVDGERRFRACQLLGMTEIEAVVRPISAKKGKARLARALVANVQRSAMGPVDEARAYQELVKELGSHEAAAERVGVSDATVSMRLSLLEFPEVVQKIFNTKNIALDIGVIARMKALSTDQQIQVATIAASRGLSAKNIKMLCGKISKGSKGKAYKQRAPRQAPEIKLVGNHFNALAMVTDLKLIPPPITSAAVATCKACPLYDEASQAVCRQCPLPDLLNRLDIKN
jgi:ParB family chromosome partitioning protein